MGCKRKIKFIDYPISNYDIIEWVKYLKIKNFKGVFSRDNLLKTIKKPECGIINLDDKIGYVTIIIIILILLECLPYRRYKIY